MKPRHGSAATAVVALLLSSVRAFAQAGSASDARDTNKPAAPAPYVGFAPPSTPLRLESSSGSLQFGLLFQPQFEMVGAPNAKLTTKNLFLRRARFMAGGTLFKYFDYFFDVDYPDLFKVDSAGQSGGVGKNAPGLNLQDAFVTFKPAGDLIKVDTGFMLPALSHNAVQGAGTLYGWDYFVNSFRRNVDSNTDPFQSTGQSPVGRDAGLQLRGLVLNDHVEYRVGIFQGFRVGTLPAPAAEVGGVNFFRVAARVQINVLDAEPGFFYQGTYLGTKKILSFGGFYDFQDEYSLRGVDAFLDLPAGPGIVTAQANIMQWDGGHFIITLPKETAMMFEVGYLIRPIMLSPILRAERLTGPTTSPSDAAKWPSEDRLGGGFAFWPFGHNANLKLFYTHVERTPAEHAYSQVNVQWQVYFY